MEEAYIVSAAHYLPGPPIDNEGMDRYIRPVNRQSARLKDRILKENGILTRHYALDETGHSICSVAQMAGHASRRALEQAGWKVNDLSLISAGTSGADTVLPGFANAVQGELNARPVETLSHSGVCGAGMSALKNAVNALRLRQHDKALVTTAEFPSRLFKHTRFTTPGYNVDFDAHFLRWMLSDGAAAVLLSNRPAARGLSLKVHWVHQKSFSGDYPLCMQVGFPEKNEPKSYLDYASFAEAEANGAFLLRQDLRLLPHLLDVGVSEYAQLVRAGNLDPAAIDYFLCHYSSERFAPVVDELMHKAGLAIPKERWFTNLSRRGNTGSASIFIMLADLLAERSLKKGERIFMFVPESGRFTVCYALLEVVDAASAPTRIEAEIEVPPSYEEPSIPPPAPLDVAGAPQLSALLKDLAGVWHDFRSRAFRTRFIRKIRERELTQAEYVRWMSHWIPQVREGSKWMRRAVENMHAPYTPLRSLVVEHAGEEQNDYNILFQDYRLAGGEVADIDELRRNAGGEALNSFMYARAAQDNPVGLLGGIYIVEGTGNRIIPALLPMLREQLPLPPDAYRFLRYHSENDPRHLERWLTGVTLALELADNPSAVADDIRKTARAVAELYLLQLEHVL